MFHMFFVSFEVNLQSKPKTISNLDKNDSKVRETKGNGIK